jgi:hypothetical protein
MKNEVIEALKNFKLSSSIFQREYKNAHPILTLIFSAIVYCIDKIDKNYLEINFYSQNYLSVKNFNFYIIF